MMLVLSRKLGERIVVGGHVVITVAAISGARVRLGITAPPQVPIRRAELDAGDALPRQALPEAEPRPPRDR
jgi:carbon storage regulator